MNRADRAALRDGLPTCNPALRPKRAREVLTVAEAAQVFGVTPRTVWRWLSGERRPRWMPTAWEAFRASYGKV